MDPLTVEGIRVLRKQKKSVPQKKERKEKKKEKEKEAKKKLCFENSQVHPDL